MASKSARKSASGFTSPPTKEAVERFDQWRRRAGRIQADALMCIMGDRRLREALYKTFSQTDYLARCCLAHPDAAVKALLGDPASVIDDLAHDLDALDRATGPTSALSNAVRPLKERAVVAIGLADITGIWTQEKVGAALSELAERILDAGLGWFVRLAFRHGEFTAQEDAAPVPLPGLFVLGGGAIAANDMSYCGPLEVALVYDPEILAAQKVTASDRAIFRIASELADAFGALNKDGTLFEIRHQGIAMAKATKTASDTAFALSVPDMRAFLNGDASPEDRAWFATTRVVAGDRKGGTAFAEELSQLLWHKGFKASDIRIAVSGEASGKDAPHRDPHRKLVDTCQLALGQQHDEFRAASGRTVFETAARIGAIGESDAARLASNYELQTVARNRLQLIRGQAVQAAESASELAAQALICGYTDPDLFATVLKGAEAEAQQHWINIIEPSKHAGFDVLGGTAGEDTDPVKARDVGKLEEIGFSDGRDVATIVDNWLKGKYANSADEAQQRLSQLAPGLLTEIGATQHPDRAVQLFDRLLNQLDENVKPFERLREDKVLADLVVDALGNTESVSEIFANTPDLVDAAFSGSSEAIETGAAWLKAFPIPRRHGEPEQMFDALNAWIWENRARLCVTWMQGLVSLEFSGQIFAALADAVVTEVYEILAERAEDKEAGGGLALMAMGRYGGGWLAADEPLEIVYVYDPKTKDKPSPEAVRKYTDLAAQVTEELTRPRALGTIGEVPLFDVELQRRPGGLSGEVASSVGVYLNYFVSQADARDSLGLMRARPICGPARLVQRIEDGISDVVTRPRQANQVIRDIDRARTQELRSDGATSIWQIERLRGGLADLDLIVQCLQLKHGPEHPYVFTSDPARAIASLSRAGCLDAEVADELEDSLNYWQRLRAIQGFTGMIDPQAERPKKRLAKLLARAAGVSDFSSIEPLIRGHAERTQAHYNRLILGQSQDAPQAKAG